MDSWFTILLSSESSSVGTKSSFTISFNLNFFLSSFFDLVDGGRGRWSFFFGCDFSVEGFWSLAGVSIVINSLGDGVFLVRDFSGFVSVEGFGSFVGEGGGVCIGEIDGDLHGDDVGETDGVFEGEGDVDGSSSSTIVGLMLGESSMTLGSSMLVTLGFRMSKQTVLGFLLDEVVSAFASLYACEISYQACSITASPSGQRARRSDLFLFVTLVYVDYALDKILKALLSTFF